MLKRTRIKELSTGDIFFINGHRFKVMGRVMRDKQVFVCAYEDRVNQIRKLNYLDLDMEVLIDGNR